MKTIAVDMDGVLADTLTAQLEWFRSSYGYHWSRAELRGKRLFEDVATKEQVLAHESMLQEGSFFEDLPVMPGAIEVVRRLAERYEIFVATAAMHYPATFSPKFRWLRRHFPFISPSQVVFCGEKGFIRADYLIDDNAHRFPRFQGRALLFDAPHNALETSFLRVSSWGDVAQLLLAHSGDRGLGASHGAGAPAYRTPTPAPVG